MSGTIPTYYAVCSSRYQPGRLPALPVPPQAPTVERQQRVKKRNGKPAQRRLPEGYVFIPPPNPLNFPPTYHFIEAGPLNERSKPKRSVLGALTNIADRVLSKRNKEPEVDLADENGSVKLRRRSWARGCGQYINLGCEMVAESGFASSRILFDWRYVWWRRWAAGRAARGFILRFSRQLNPGDTAGGGVGLLVGSVWLGSFLVSRVSTCM
ncbi:hypothetical protein R3P38DRAFT_3171317 [Favolaschia claudopus]|uniref:Uncharacterized protein n=1 Tax=Favolaschia claudopus TaxID=2862362 RepID=A0AAW0DSF4_9AGAR